jgi:hypothetical protein
MAARIDAHEHETRSSECNASQHAVARPRGVIEGSATAVKSSTMPPGPPHDPTMTPVPAC